MLDQQFVSSVINTGAAKYKRLINKYNIRIDYPKYKYTSQYKRVKAVRLWMQELTIIQVWHR